MASYHRIAFRFKKKKKRKKERKEKKTIQLSFSSSKKGNKRKWKESCKLQTKNTHEDFRSSIKDNTSPGWYGSVDWAPSCEPKGRWFNSQSRHMPGLWARSPVGGVQEATCFSHTSIFLSLSLSLPSGLSKNK